MTKPSLRLDKWLVCARFCKTRALAQKMIERGYVAVNGKTVSKTSQTLCRGDTLAVILGSLRRTVIVKDGSDRRVSSAESKKLYDEPQPPQRLSGEDRGLPLYAL